VITTHPSISDLLDDARAGLTRLDPREAWTAWALGALLVDIRPAAQRAIEGDVPGALVIERNVLEWRLDPCSDARLPIASHDLHVIVLCSEGFTSSLAAASLQQLGVHRATDVVGGFRAWVAAGLPTSGASVEARSPVTVDRASRTVLAGDRQVDLTRMEFDLLAYVVARPMRVHTRDHLLQAVWGDGRNGGTRTVDVHVHRLRAKLGQPYAASLVTLRGVGYRWSPPKEPAG
jgi:rhodanese-related sulfurtransferase